MPPLKVMTNGGEGPGSRARGTAEPYQRMVQSLLPHIALISGTHRHWKIRRLNCPIRIWFRAPIWVRTRCWAFLSGTGLWKRGRQREWSFSQTPNGRLWKVGWMEGTNDSHTHLVEGITGDSRSQQCPGTRPEDKGLFWAASMDEQDPWCQKLLPGTPGP